MTTKAHAARAWLWALVLLMLLARASAGAAPRKAAPYALIFGTVWGADQRPVSGVKVKLRRAAEKKFRWERVSDARGEFAFRVPAEAADYVVLAEPGGRRAAVETAVHIEFDERTDISIHLKE